MTLRDEIGVNETIVWQGKKDKRVSVFEAIFNPLLIFALVWFIFDMKFISPFSSYAVHLEQKQNPCWYFSLSIWLLYGSTLPAY